MRKEFIIMALILIALFTLHEAFAQEAPLIQTMPQSDGSLLIHINPAMVKLCGDEGGCRVVSVKDLDDWLRALKPNLCGTDI